MEEKYDTDAFVVFLIALISIYIVIALFFIFTRIRRFFSGETTVDVIALFDTIEVQIKEASVG